MTYDMACNIHRRSTHTHLHNTCSNSSEAQISSVHELVDVCVFRHPVHLHVLQRRKVMEDIEENIVEKGVVFDVVVKLQTVVVGSICQSLFVVKQAT